MLLYRIVRIVARTTARTMCTATRHRRASRTSLSLPDLDSPASFVYLHEFSLFIFFLISLVQISLTTGRKTVEFCDLAPDDYDCNRYHRICVLREYKMVRRCVRSPFIGSLRLSSFPRSLAAAASGQGERRWFTLGTAGTFGTRATGSTIRTSPGSSRSSLEIPRRS